DELYWNVTGNFWSFPIEKASATIHLPPGASILDAQALTGHLGSEAGEATFGFNADGAHVTATRPLSSGEGLTFRVSWPKGVVSEPTAFESLNYAVRDNAGVLV